MNEEMKDGMTMETATGVTSEASSEASTPIAAIPIEAVWQTSRSEVREEPYPEKKSDRRLAVVMFILAFLLVDIMGFIRPFTDYGLGVTVFTVIYGAVVFLYARQKNIKISREGWFWFGIIVVTGLSFTLVDNYSLGWFMSLFLRLVMIYFPLILFGAGINGQTSEFFLVDWINASALVPLYNFRAQWKFARRGMQKVKIAGTIVKAFLGILVSIPLFMLVANLLASADSGFGDLLFDLSWNIREDVFHFIWTLVLSLPVGCYLYGVIYGSANKRGTGMISKEGVISTCKVFAVIPTVSIYAALTGLCLLYVMFISLQGSYYISALRGVLPEGFTYSEFARSGFFELVQISLINICILGAAELFSKSKGRLLKGYRFVVSLLTIFLIITAMTKMVLYIDAYGLTQLRVISSAFMIFLAVVFLMIIIHQFRQFPLVWTTVITLALGITVLAMSNMDGQIARYNLNRYQAGTLQDLPEVTLSRCGASAVPEIYKVWSQEQDPDKKAIWEQTVKKIGYQYDYRFGTTNGLKKWNLARMNASDIYVSMEIK